MNSSNVQIMWKEIAIIFFVLYFIRLCIDCYIKVIYSRISGQFYSGTWEGLEEKINEHLKICDFFSNGPWNKNIRVMYNGLRIALASMAFLKDDEIEFVNQLSKVKNEDEFELKPFVLALYYYSKKDLSAAEKYFECYLQCNRKSHDINIIMEYLFSKEKARANMELNSVVKNFRNPAIIKLFRDNKLIN